ncbi:glycerate kinase type-2 family protein [Planctomicrobium sp. SH527]|uniref:glycerate kinase type-2 family protein n=1 Tax=Planctomicrobium sp. SH527 TaxID=3448123 RepID=UPI003F5C4328
MDLEYASSDSLVEDVLSIWKAGVAAVDSRRLVSTNIVIAGDTLRVGQSEWVRKGVGRICVVGAGKAGAGMAAGVEDCLPGDWLATTTGWVNVPDDCVIPLEKIHLHGARPAGVNEPTERGVAGTREILQLVSKLNADDLCLVLISGGGSALLPAPSPGISLEDKLTVTRSMMRGGATISELNCVRRAISEVKGGGLLRACQAGTMIVLLISDVIGDPLETIASGPTVNLNPSAIEALEVLEQFQDRSGFSIPLSILEYLKSHRAVDRRGEGQQDKGECRCSHHVIGNNRTAVLAAVQKATELGYDVVDAKWDLPGDAAETGRKFADQLLAIGTNQVNRSSDSPNDQTASSRLCVVAGGETTVNLAVTPLPQKGGRNQELVLTALVELASQEHLPPLAIVSGGTDGEDGPTDAAGAWLNCSLIEEVQQGKVDPVPYLQINNSYPFLESVGALLKTGPTHTNVMDLRVGLVLHRGS